MAHPRPRLPQKTWLPNHGIIFSPASTPGAPRQFSNIAIADLEAEIQDEHLSLHSRGEVNPETASAGESESEPKPAELDSKDAESTAPERKVEPIPQNPKHNELPETPTKFKMTEELFRAAKRAEKDTPESFWSHKLYRGPEVDGISKKPIVHYCRTKVTMERVLKEHFVDKKVIGFDLEWNPESYLYKSKGARQTVSLIQLATEERIALFHLALFPKAKTDIEDLVTPLLKKIMEDPTVTKCGVSIKSDCTRLRNNLSINSQGLFELSHLFKLIKFSESKEYSQINKKLVSLAKQVQWHLHLPMYKSQTVRSSDWSQPLSLEQILYAASDSYAAVQLFAVMDMKRKALKPTPPLPYHAELNIPIRIAEGVEIPTDSEGDDLDPEDAIEDDEIDTTTTPIKGSASATVLPKTPNTRSKAAGSVKSKDADNKSSLYPLLSSPPATRQQFQKVMVKAKVDDARNLYSHPSSQEQEVSAS